jgi:hypothetical protein
MNRQVITCIITQKVFRNNAILASRIVRIGTSGRSSSVDPIKWPVALAHIFSKLFISLVTVPLAILDSLANFDICVLYRQLQSIGHSYLFDHQLKCR